MTRTRLFHACTLVLLASALPIAAKPPKPTNTPVSAAFRCQLGILCVEGDRILGDPGGPYVGTLTTMLGAFLNPNNDLWLLLDLPGNQSLTMDFGAQVGSAPCGAKCRRSGSFTFPVVTTFSSPYGSGVNPTDAAGTDLPNGLLGMSVEPTYEAKAKVHINFPDPYGRSLVWTVRFNTKDYPGSSYASVTRVTANTWTVKASGAQLAKLVASPSGGVQQQTDEGLFEMPFELTIVKP